jgi:hypothetical protein
VRYGGRVQMQELVSQSSYLSSNDPRLHFGLGAATEVDIEVFWPSGTLQKLLKVAVDRILTLNEGVGVVLGKVLPRK